MKVKIEEVGKTIGVDVIHNKKDDEIVIYLETTKLSGNVADCVHLLVSELLDKMNFNRNLLSKYMEHIGACEGIDYVSDFHIKGAGFTDIEIKELQRISKESNYE